MSLARQAFMKWRMDRGEKVIVKFDGGSSKKIIIISLQHFDLTSYFVHLHDIILVC